MAQSSGAKAATKAAKQSQRRKQKSQVAQPAQPVVPEQDQVEEVAQEILSSPSCYGRLYEPGNNDCDVRCGWTEDCKQLMLERNAAYAGAQALVEEGTPEPPAESATEQPPENEYYDEQLADGVDEQLAEQYEQGPYEREQDAALEADLESGAYDYGQPEQQAYDDQLQEGVEDPYDQQMAALEQPELAEGDVGGFFGDDLLEAADGYEEQPADDQGYDDGYDGDDLGQYADDEAIPEGQEFEGMDEGYAEIEDQGQYEQPDFEAELDAEAGQYQDFEAELDAEVQAMETGGDVQLQQEDAYVEAELDAEVQAMETGDADFQAQYDQGEFTQEELQDIAAAAAADTGEIDELEQALMEEENEVLQPGDMTDEELLAELSDDPLMEAEDESQG